MITPAVLFVCLGNICRSPLAEAAFRKAADEAGLDAIADSAGTAAYHIGAAPDDRAIRTAAQHGIDISAIAGARSSNATTRGSPTSLHSITTTSPISNASPRPTRWRAWDCYWMLFPVAKVQPWPTRITAERRISPTPGKTSGSPRKRLSLAWPNSAADAFPERQTTPTALEVP